MSAPPLRVVIKRKREDSAPDALILEEAVRHAKRRNVQYHLQPSPAATRNLVKPQGNHTALQNTRAQDDAVVRTSSGPLPVLDTTSGPRTVGASTPRHFELVKTKKRGADELEAPTFVAKRSRTGDPGTESVQVVEPVENPLNGRTSTPLKRPGANAQEKKWRAENWTQTPEAKKDLGTPQRTPSQTQSLAEAMHQFALEAAAEDEQDASMDDEEEEAAHKPKVKYQPKRPVRRMRDRQPKQAVQSETLIQDTLDVNMDTTDDDDYVYDIYIRATQSSKVIKSDTTDPSSASIGYLIITEHDVPIWETYLEEDEEENDWDSEDEDENGSPL